MQFYGATVDRNDIHVKMKYNSFAVKYSIR